MQWRVTKLESTMATAAMREDLPRLKVTLHREILGIQRDISGSQQAIALIHQAVSAQTWKILSTWIGTPTGWVAVTYYLVKNS